MARFYFGQIVLAYIQDGKGRTKERPALIISNDEECKTDSKLLVIAITKNMQDPRTYHFKIHDSQTRDPISGLNYPCVAKCNWVREIESTRIIRSVGYMQDDILRSIIQMFDTLYADPDFNDWQ